MSKEYDVFVEGLRQELMERLGLSEKQVYFEERDEDGMTPNGDRLFVECSASSAGKEVCGIHTEELFEDYEDGVSLEKIAETVENEIRKLKETGFFEKTKNLNNYEKVKKDLFIRLLNVKQHKRELSRAGLPQSWGHCPGALYAARQDERAHQQCKNTQRQSGRMEA